MLTTVKMLPIGGAAQWVLGLLLGCLAVVRPWIAVGSGMQQVLCLIYVPYCSDKHVSDHLPPGHLHAT